MIWKNEFDVPVIVHYATKDGGHSWPGGNKVRPGADPPSKAIDANTLIWDFFKRWIQVINATPMFSFNF